MNISYPPVASSFVGLDILSGILSILNSWYRITKHITGHLLYAEYSFLNVISYTREYTKCRKQTYNEVLSVQLYVSSPKPLLTDFDNICCGKHTLNFVKQLILVNNVHHLTPILRIAYGMPAEILVPSETVFSARANFKMAMVIY
jgi:hypothetical protein